MAIKLNKEVSDKYKFSGAGTKFSHLGNEVVINERLTIERADELYNTGFGHFELKNKKPPKKRD